jgi:L-lactate dehydrogenase
MPGSKVSVVGAGRVGSAVANALVLLRACDRVVPFDRDPARAEGEAWDIAATIPLLAEREIVPSGDNAGLGGSEAVVVTVGATRTPRSEPARAAGGQRRASPPTSCVSSIGPVQTRS